MIMKLEIGGVMMNVVSAYAPQVGCAMGEKEDFWSELDEVMNSVPKGQKVVIGADFNGHVGEGNSGDEEVMGRYGVKERNEEGQRIVDFAKWMDMAVVNMYFKKREEHTVTYKSGGRCTQVDYILCRRVDLKEIEDCKVVAGECGSQIPGQPQPLKEFVHVGHGIGIKLGDLIKTSEVITEPPGAIQLGHKDDRNGPGAMAFFDDVHVQHTLYL
ncbi:craniofacial development protein 2-like [Erpetoichthys calabaricus]|uniref:craniofacial development protein 2-like n=1 Tax=Erpetoichthys calabaricus TaxID=27687 RepID=UPI0022340E25|nr:craniofacial development protein 2-like [Erpetoichthys calabaricus]